MKKTIFILWVFSLFSWASAQEKSESIWPLTVGDEWEFSVIMELPHGADLAKEEDVVIKETSEGLVVTYTEVQRYLGKKSPKEGAELMDAFAVMRNGKLKSTEYLEIAEKGIFGRASQTLKKNEEGEDEEQIVILEKPLLLVTQDSKAGDTWKVAGAPDENGHVMFRRYFRSFGKEKVSVPAGDYEGTKIEVVGNNGALELRREYWFVEALGFVKEVKNYYAQDRRILRHTQVLTKFTKATETTEKAE